jgi:hypothetical protein
MITTISHIATPVWYIPVIILDVELSIDVLSVNVLSVNVLSVNVLSVNVLSSDMLSVVFVASIGVSSIVAPISPFPMIIPNTPITIIPISNPSIERISALLIFSVIVSSAC